MVEGLEDLAATLLSGLDQRELLAAIDLGTSHVRLGAWLPNSERIDILGDHPSQVSHGPGGSARCSFAAYRQAVRALLEALGRTCKAERIKRVRLAITGQVSSLITWADGAPAPERDDFPIWMDTSCRPALPEFARAWDGGGALAALGTCLPAATNWLAVKIRHHLGAGAPTPGVRFLQLQDAIARDLTGRLLSHPSAQISLVDHRTGGYSAAVLAMLGIVEQALPPLDPTGSAELDAGLAREAGLPAVSVHLAPHDTHAALYGMCPADGDGVLMAGTSEIVGVYEAAARAKAPTRMVSTPLGAGWMLYGSSSSGGATIDWLMRMVLRRSGAEELQRLTREAEAVPPGADGLVVLPYLSGERAPLWDATLTGSILGLKAHHTDAHLLRAALEGVACARRQGAEALERALPARFLASGGGTANMLWNRIRAAVLGRPLAVLSSPDLALIGAMRWACHGLGRPDQGLRALARARTVAPDPAWAEDYRGVYAAFLEAQARSRHGGGAAGGAHA